MRVGSHIKQKMNSLMTIVPLRQRAEADNTESQQDFVRTSATACRPSARSRAPWWLLRPEKGWNQTEHCSSYQLQRKSKTVKHLLKAGLRISESRQMEILTCGRTLCPRITVRFFTMDRLWPGFFGLGFRLSKPLLLQNLLLFFP